MAVFFGVGGKAKKVPNLYIGVGGKAKKVKAGWIGVGGKAKLFYAGADISGTMTDYWTGRLADWESNKSGKQYYDMHCQHSGNTSTDQINTLATVINKQMTVKGKKTDTSHGHEGYAAIFNSQKVQLTNGHKIRVTVSVQNAGTRYLSNIYGQSVVNVRYGTKLPNTGKVSIFANTTSCLNSEGKTGGTRLSTSQTVYEFTFNGTTGEYYLGLYLEADVINSSCSTRDDYQMCGQMTLKSIEIL